VWSEFVDTVLGAFTAILVFLHDIVAAVPFLTSAAWGWAIILLTLIVRVLLLPLAIKQTRSMRAMQKLQPQIKELQKKHKVDRSLMKKDPEQYKAKRAKLNEEMMALYQREGANPAASCLPLLAQAPIFVALFWTLNRAEELRGAEFYFFTAVGEGGLEQIVRGAGWPGWLLILLMSGTMFWSQKQMMAKQSAQMADNPMAQQQKILLYVMPVFLAVISVNFPMGVLLYWVTTNFWQVAQQAIILREVQHEAEAEAASGGPSPSGGTPSGPSKGATSGKQKSKGATSGKQKKDDGPAGAEPRPDDAGGAERGEGKDQVEGDDRRAGKRRPRGKGAPDSEGRAKGAGRRKDRPGTAGSEPKDRPGTADSEPSDGSKEADNGRPRGRRRSPNGEHEAGGKVPDQRRKRDHLPRRGEGR
jgi:YidC/Oxa1 family membrane protein insertase